MNNIKHKPIARRLALRVSLVLAAALMLLLVGVFLSFKRTMKKEAENYTKVLVTIYADVSIYEAHKQNRPIDLSFSESFNFFGEYICSWYRVGYLYVFVPDIEKGTITYLSVTRNPEKFGEASREHMTGVTEEHILTGNELKAWNNPNVCAVEKVGRFGGRLDVLLAIEDDFGNKAMVGAGLSADNVRKGLLQAFLIVALFMFIIVVIVAGLIYLLISRMVSRPAQKITRKMADYISGGERSTISLEGNDEFTMMAGAFNHMTEVQEKYIEDLARLGREQERQQAEVDIAAAIQKGILSGGNAYSQNCCIKALMSPAKYIGGDLYDYFELDKSRTLIVIADVSGKGISSALLMAVALTLIRQFARLGYSPAGVLKQVNDTFSEENPQMMFVTAFVGIYDSDRGTLTYANAGHNPPYLIHGEPRILEGSDGTPLGLFAGEEYTDVEVPVEEGDAVFLFTDGVNEAVNSAGEFYGTDRLEEVLKETAGDSENDIVGSVYASVREFAGEAEQNDDITMLALRARKNPVLELDYDINEFSVIRDRLFSSGLTQSLLMDLCVAAEECFVNICSYAFDGPAPAGEKIQFYFEYSNKVVMRFSDGGRRFDPRTDLPNLEEYDVDTAEGGLGRLIAFTVADSVDYEYRDGRNILTITKSIKK